MKHGELLKLFGKAVSNWYSMANGMISITARKPGKSFLFRGTQKRSQQEQ